MLHGKARVGERFCHTVSHASGSFFEPHADKGCGDCLCLCHAGIKGFLSMDRLEHLSDQAALGLGNFGEHVAVEVHGVSLIGRIREDLRDRTCHGRCFVAGDHTNT